MMKMPTALAAIMPANTGMPTERRLSMAAPVAVTDQPTDLSRVRELPLVDAPACRRLWTLSPYVVEWNEADLRVALDYRTDPYLTPGTPRPLGLKVTNPGRQPLTLHVAVTGLPAGWTASGLPNSPIPLEPGATKSLEFTILAASGDEDATRLKVEVTGSAKTIAMPLTLLGREGPGPDDLALATKGAVATSDGELEREKGCTPRAIDGVIAGANDFEEKRWHSAIDTPHPHWVQVKLPQPTKIGRVVLRFADPAGRPVDFKGLVRGADGQEWQEVFAVKGYTDARKFRRDITPVAADTFRLVIEKSVNPVTLNAAQISEIELYPPVQ